MKIGNHKNGNTLLCEDLSESDPWHCDTWCLPMTQILPNSNIENQNRQCNFLFVDFKFAVDNSGKDSGIFELAELMLYKEFACSNFIGCNFDSSATTR